MTQETLKPQQLALYYSPHCPFCHRVLDAMVGLGLNPDLKSGEAGGIALRNTAADKKHAKALKDGGGKSTVPCLSIEKDGAVSWLYESLDIINFLKTRVDI